MKRTLIVLSIALAGAVPTASAASMEGCDDPESSFAEPLELCGETILTGSSPSVVRVTLTETVTIRSGFDTEITGSAPIAGFAIVDEDWRRAYVGGLFPQIPLFDGLPRFFSLGEHDGVAGSETFPPGEYNLFLLADGSEVTVTLHLSGLSGRIELAPTTVADYRGGFLSPRYAAPTGHYFSADRTEELPLGGLGLRIAWIQSEGPGDAQAGTCGSNAAPALGWFECGGLGSTTPGGGQFGSYETAAQMLDPGTYNQGGVAFSAAATVYSVGVLAVWLGRS